MNKNGFNRWIRDVINTQATPNGNSVLLDDFSSDGTTEYSYPKEFVVNGDKYYWDVGTRKTKGRGMSSHYELWFHGKAFNGGKRISTGEITLNRVKMGLKEIYNYYIEQSENI